MDYGRGLVQPVCGVGFGVTITANAVPPLWLPRVHHLPLQMSLRQRF